MRPTLLRCGLLEVNNNGRTQLLQQRIHDERENIRYTCKAFEFFLHFSLAKQ